MQRAAICSVCGRTARPAYTCSLCGAICCAADFDQNRNICRKCSAGRMVMDH